MNAVWDQIDLIEELEEGREGGRGGEREVDAVLESLDL